MIFPITDDVEIMNGINPTANKSLIDTRVKRNIINNGTTLAGIASNRQFNSGH
jgi:hypothetical protein